VLLQCDMFLFDSLSTTARARLRTALPWLGSVAAHGLVIFNVGLGAHWLSEPTTPPPIEIVLQTPPDSRAAPVAAQKAPPALPPTIAPPVSKTVLANPASPPTEQPVILSTSSPTATVMTAAAQPLQAAAIAVPSPTPATKTVPVAAPAPTPFIHADVKTAYLQNPKPNYPTISNRLGEAGTVTLWVTVNAVGTVDDLGVLRSSGYARLDAEALKTVRTWRFTPAKRGGEPVTDKVSVPIEFGL
jgi:periplasmic protein TonB